MKSVFQFREWIQKILKVWEKWQKSDIIYWVTVGCVIVLVEVEETVLKTLVSG